ncbi:(2Fe-2S) ferredoxin domain-containing protein [Verrucomicrobiota bacterium sgz303538]
MNDHATSDFNLRGEIAGFFKDVFGNRQMVLRNAGGEVFLEIPKALSRELEGTLAVGLEVGVSGKELSAEATGRRRRIVSQVSPAKSLAPRTACPIRVCSNKTCWLNGGQTLWKALEEKIAQEGLESTVALKAVPCMNLCKQGPNVEIRGEEFHHCSASTVDEILAPFTESHPKVECETAVRI